MALVEVIAVEQCGRGRGTFVEHDGRELAVFRLASPDRVVVIDNACPHASGNLSGGEVEGNLVRCPRHHWEFDLDRGVCTNSEHARLRRYPAEVRNGVVWVDLRPRVV